MLKSAPANFTLYPLLWLSVCFAFGILTANLFAFDWRIHLAVCLLFAILSFIFIKTKLALIFLSLAFIAVGSVYFQIENQTIEENRIKKIYDENRISSGDPLEVEGVLQGKPELAVGGFFLVLETERAFYKNAEIKTSGKIRLFAPAVDRQIEKEYEQFNLNHGARLRVACRLRRENDFLNVGVLPQTELLDQKQIDATGVIKSPLLVEKIGGVETFAPLAWIYERRENLIVAFRDNFDARTAGVLIASLLGNSHFLDKQTADVFRAGGTFHVLVISGLHITFIGGLTLLLIRFFTNRRFWQFLIATAFLWAYSLAVGADVPVVRAAIMFTILLFSQTIYRSGTLLNSLGFCALILLVWRPSDVYTSSFQLTFASVAAIVAIAFPLVEKLRAIGDWSPSVTAPFPPHIPIWLKRFCERLYWREAVWEKEAAQQLWSAKLFKSLPIKWLAAGNLQTFFAYLFEALLVSSVMQICLLPLTILYFHRFPVLGVFLNLWVGIVIALESFAAIFAVFLAGLNQKLALPIIKLTETLNWLLIAVPNFFTESNWANLRLPVYSGGLKAIYILYFAPVIFLAIILNKWSPFSLTSNSKFQILNFKFSASPSVRVAASLLILLSALIVFHPFSAPTADGRLHVDFLDVGQGDAALVRFPNGETLLVDGGGKENFNRINSGTEAEPEFFDPDTRTVGEAVVSEFLWERGFSQIDYILATHADADHIQGLSDIAQNFRVRAAIFGQTPIKNVEFARLNSILAKRGIESLTVARGDVLTFGAVKIEVLHPPRGDLPETVSENDNSIVLRIIYGNRKILLTGDIEQAAEKDLLNMPGSLQADVIKVAHHGSRTSSTAEFIRATRAKVAVISVGKDSPYGHPHAEVVERWKEASARVLTTGENGTISVSTDGEDLQLRTFTKEKIYR